MEFRRVLFRSMRAMEQIITEQGAPPGNGSPLLEPASAGYEVLAPQDGVVQGIDCLRIARVARMAGAPAFKGAGVDLLKKTGDAVRKGEPLYRIHAALSSDLGFAADLAAQDSGRSEERRVGTECVSTCRSRWSPEPYNK